MHGVVKIHGLDAIYYLPDVPDEGDDWEVEEGAWVEVGPDVAEDPLGSDRPASWTLAISKADPKHYRLFKYPEGVESAGFEPTGRSYGGVYTRSMWERLVEIIPSMKAFEAIGGNDRPGAMDEALRCIRGAR